MATRMTRWADISKGVEDTEDHVMLPPTVENIDESGIKTTTEFRKKAVEEKTGESQYVKILRTSRFNNVKRRVSKRSFGRKKLAKFGACEGQENGVAEQGITAVCVDNVLFEFEKDKKEEEENEFPSIRPQNPFAHFIHSIVPQTTLDEVEPPDTRVFNNRSRIGPRPGINTMETESTPTIRILELPRKATFDDIKDLVRPFNSKRIKLPKDNWNHDPSLPKDECPNRGFAFVQFGCRSDAESAMKALHKHAYGTHILHVEWSRNYLNYIKQNKDNPVVATGRPRFHNSSRLNKRLTPVNLSSQRSFPTLGAEPVPKTTLNNVGNSRPLGSNRGIGRGRPRFTNSSKTS